jgi:hypothetical protein
VAEGPTAQTRHGRRSLGCAGVGGSDAGGQDLTQVRNTQCPERVVVRGLCSRVIQSLTLSLLKSINLNFHSRSEAAIWYFLAALIYLVLFDENGLSLSASTKTSRVFPGSFLIISSIDKLLSLTEDSEFAVTSIGRM